MGGNQGARLARVEQGLTPRQAMVLWLEEAHRHGSLQAHARWLKEQPMSAYPLVRLPQQVREAVRVAANGQRWQDVDALAQRAERDVTFLFKLFLEVNARVLAGRKADALGYLWLLERLRRLSGATLRQVRDEAGFWRERALPLAAEAYALAGMVENIGERYFGGHAVLFPDDAAGVVAASRAWDRLLEMYADRLEGLPAKQREALALTPQSVRTAGQVLTKHDIGYVVAKAKAETLRQYDEDEAAAVLVEPYL